MPYDVPYAGSDADDEYERSGIACPTLPINYESLTSTTDSDTPSNEDTPTTFAHSRTAHASPRGIITTWSPGDCADYLASIGLEQYRAAMIDECIDGEALIVMQHADLKDAGIASTGHRLTILKGVYNTKMKHNIPIEDEHYVPLSADVHVPEVYATQEDLTRLLDEIRLRDQRIQADLQQMKEDMNRVMDEQKKLREDALPVIRMAKNRLQPLPTPEAQTHDPMSLPPSSLQIEHKAVSGLSRKFSAKKLFLGSNTVTPSPTIREGVTDQSPGITTTTHLMAAPAAAPPQLSPGVYSQQNSPTSPPPFVGTLNSMASRSTINAATNRIHQQGHWSQASTLLDRNSAAMTQPHWSQVNTLVDRNSAVTLSTANPSRRDPPDPPPSVAPSTTPASGASDIMKSFRVSGEAPCHKVLPLALKKYHINDDPRQYSLYIVHGDQERCLGLDEKPMMLFKQLATEGRQPMFMLRKHATPREGFVNTREKGLDAAGGGANLVGALQMQNGQTRAQSMYGAVQLPGGVL